MKLFYLTGACSLAPHIALEEVGAKYELSKVDPKTKITDANENYFDINPKGQVPALKTLEGKVLTEVAIILQYISDQYPEKNLLPKAGTWERYKAIEWLNYVGTEIHKGMGILFSADRLIHQKEGNEEFRKNTKEGLAKKFDYLSENLKNNSYLLGSQYSVADCYLYTILSWHGFLKVDLTKWPVLLGYMERVQARPAVQAALKSEGLI